MRLRENTKREMKAELLVESRMTPPWHRKQGSSYENEMNHSRVLWVLSGITMFLGLEISLLWGDPFNMFFLKAFFLLKDSEGYSITQWIDMVWIQRWPWASGLNTWSLDFSSTNLTNNNISLSELPQELKRIIQEKHLSTWHVENTLLL